MHCKQTKLLSDFEFGMSLPTKDHRAVTCNMCMKKFEEEEQEQGHTEECIENKFLLAVSTQLDALLALAENGMLIPDEILDLMCTIIEQDEKNVKDLQGRLALIMRRVIINYNMKKQSPPKLPKPKPISQLDERRQLERNLENYTCQLPKDLSQRARNRGLEEGKTVCSLMYTAVEEYLKKHQPENP